MHAVCVRSSQSLVERMPVIGWFVLCGGRRQAYGSTKSSHGVPFFHPFLTPSQKPLIPLSIWASPFLHSVIQSLFLSLYVSFLTITLVVSFCTSFQQFINIQLINRNPIKILQDSNSSNLFRYIYFRISGIFQTYQKTTF